VTPSTGWALVGMQFGLLAGLVILPYGGLWPRGGVALVFTVTFVVVGIFVAVVAGLRLGRTLTPLPIPKDDGALVTGGIYRFVRHPVYSGVLLAALGALVWGASLPHVVGFVALWGVLLTKVMGEEKMLGEKYSGYSAYAKATGRLFPRLGR